jgi:threonine/homoserine/homoserine lactone efflux protein
MMVEFFGELQYLHIITFSLAFLAIYLAPGLDTMFIVSNGIGGGPKIGFSCAIGVTIGTLFHVILAIFGVSYLL